MKAHDPETYGKMLKPHADRAARDVAHEAFVEAVYRARKRYRIPNVVVMAQTLHYDGDEVVALASGDSMGDSTKTDRLVAAVALEMLKENVR